MSMTRSILIICFACGICIPGPAPGQEVARGVRRVGAVTSTEGYRKSWALLIGINYSGRQDELRGDPANQRILPELKNAANDAKALAEVLKKYYSYSDETVTVLSDDGDENSRPTTARIREEITKLCDPERVHPDDSVFVFFAGHGLRLENQSSLDGNAVTLLPYDVQLANGRLVGLNKFDLPDEFLRMLSQIPAEHKLITLDCCYSGEIFNARGGLAFQSRGEAANRSDRNLLHQTAFQAMASCRATQLASDGRDKNSKFTTALLDGLKHLPARSDSDRRVWANRLLAYISRDFDERQRPECRDLIGSNGEFCFFPREPERFAEFALRQSDKSHLKAMVVSRQGSWWFDEIPWFIPSIRSEIIKKHELAQLPNRSASFSELIEIDQLRAAAEDLFEQQKIDRQQNSDSGSLARLRQEHAQELFGANDAKKREAALLRIESDLLSMLPGSQTSSELQTAPATVGIPVISGIRDFELAPEDLHLLAVVQQALGKKQDAELSYVRAIAAYDTAQQSDPDRLLVSLHIPAALCRADHGELLLQELQEPLKATAEFSAARKNVLGLLNDSNRAEDSAAFFQIFMLCREADAWLGINRWSMANDCLGEALRMSEALAPNHYLQAHVYRRQAWSEIIQWRIAAAKSSFTRANEILEEHFRKEAEIRGEVIEPEVSSTNSSLNPPASEAPIISDATEVGLDAETSIPVLSPFFKNSTDHASKIAYLHNLHGIAMSLRFEGSTSDAAGYYRWLYGEVEDAFSQFRDSANDADVEKQFTTRRINTQERLGDCNLFGDPAIRDVPEAADDYRRALSFVHLLRGTERERIRAGLMYKHAIALSLPSHLQDTQLALDICQHADETYLQMKDKATGSWQVLGELTTKIVQCLHAASSTNSPDRAAESGTNPTLELRAAIENYRDLIKSTPHRDQLELCLFASKVLLEFGRDRDHFQTHSDANLLLSFCRIGLHPYTNSGDNFAAGESQAYLRPYYDAVIRAKLQLSSKQAKDLLEIQQEATRGTSYIKGENRFPILATYVLDGNCFLLFDIPRGQSQCIPLADLYEIREIKQVCYASDDERLPLPQIVRSALEEWFQNNPDVNIQEWEQNFCWWSDSVRGLPRSLPRYVRETSTSNLPNSSKKLELKGHFPFQLPKISHSEGSSVTKLPKPQPPSEK